MYRFIYFKKLISFCTLLKQYVTKSGDTLLQRKSNGVSRQFSSLRVFYISLESQFIYGTLESLESFETKKTGIVFYKTLNSFYSVRQKYLWYRGLSVVDCKALRARVSMRSHLNVVKLGNWHRFPKRITPF